MSGEVQVSLGRFRVATHILFFPLSCSCPKPLVVHVEDRGRFSPDPAPVQAKTHPSLPSPPNLSMSRLRTEDDADDELLSVAVVKGGKKVVVGTQSGVLNLYSWGAMRDCSDR